MVIEFNPQMGIISVVDNCLKNLLCGKFIIFINAFIIKYFNGHQLIWLAYCMSTLHLHK
jgi:hypothetical protein